ncbi:MAG: Carbon-monoxide dehydrogenase (acceptor) [Modestobacter sp.]|nr:Carbon-monoxide dehydrogenase (acceptor) [Modestobacter sp.]
MKPVDFELHRPDTLAEAVALLAEHGEDSKVLAGGQSLVPLLNFRLARPEHLIDLGRIASLTTLRRTSERLQIGAMVTHAQAERSAAVAAAAPLMSRAIPHIAHQAIRARGTVGGSIAHGDPAAELPAVAVALDAEMVVVGPRGTRHVPAAEFFRANLVTALDSDEVLTAIWVRPPTGRTGAAFDEVGRRRGDFALVGAGAQVRLDADGAVAEARIALTGVSPTPRRVMEAEAVLVGQRLDPDRLRAAADATRQAVHPSGDLHATADYRRDVAGTLVHRVVAVAAQRAATATAEEGATP